MALVGETSRRRWYPGWFIVAICFLLVSLVFGIRFNFGIFFEAIVRKNEFSTSRGAAAAVYSVNMMIFTLSGTPVGWLLDRLSIRAIFSAGFLILASGLVMSSTMTSLRHFYLYYGVWAGLGMSLLSLSGPSIVISRWFPHEAGAGNGGQRGLALGIAFAGTGAGVMVLAPLIERLITFTGWRTTFVLLAVLVLVVGIPLTMLLRDAPPNASPAPPVPPTPDAPDAPPDAPSDSPTSAATATANGGASPSLTLKQSLQTRTFWLIMAGGLLSYFSMRLVTIHLVTYLVDRGMPRLTAATVAGNAGLVVALSFIFLGSLSDRIGREYTFAIGSLAQICAFALLIAMPGDASLLMLALYVVLWGVGEGSRSGLLIAIANDRFSGPAIGTINGALIALFAVGAAFGSWSGGAVYDWSGSYVPAMVLAAGSTVVATLCVMLLRRP